MSKLSTRTLGENARSSFRLARQGYKPVTTGENHEAAIRELVRRAKLGDAVLSIHQMLYPERYPRELQPDHIFWLQTPEDEVEVGEFEWSSETIEWVAAMLNGALANDPRAVLTPGPPEEDS